MILAITNRFRPACLARCGCVGNRGETARAGMGWLWRGWLPRRPNPSVVQGTGRTRLVNDDPMARAAHGWLGLVALEEEEAGFPFADDLTGDG